MHRMTISLLAAVLVAFPATAVAQEANDDAERPTFALRIEPRATLAKPGGEATFAVLVESRVDQRISLAASEGALASAGLAVHAGHANRTTLTVKVAADAPPRVLVTVTATGPDGERVTRDVVLETARHAPRPHPAPHASASLRLVVDPPAARGEAADGTLSFRVRIASRVEQEVNLSLRHVPDAWRASVEPATVKVGPGVEATARVTLALADENATPQKGRVLLVASGADARREVALHAAFGHEPRPCAPRGSDEPPCHRPMPHRPAPREGDLLRLYAMLLERVLRLEAALRAHGIHVDASASAEAHASTA